MTGGKPSDTKWMEIFHSKPSMQRCYFLEKFPSGEFSVPCVNNMLRDASHIRSGFRVIRRKATRVEFVLTDGSSRNWDDNNGANYVIDGVPGRYVVEHGIRRVGEADERECEQATLRYGDRFIQICFRADLWKSCYALFQRNGGDWTPSPGIEMTRILRPGQLGRNFELVIEAQILTVAFNNGADIWDSNNGKNYLIGTPGKYIIADGQARYMSPSDKDRDLDPGGTPQPGVADNTSKASVMNNSGDVKASNSAVAQATQ